MPLPLPLWLSFPKGIRVRNRHTLSLAAALLLSATLPAQPPKRKLFTSPNSEDRVSFTYPAAWLLNADDDAATAKLRLADLAQPRAVVQLEGNFAGEGPYKGTDFEAGAFAYTVVDAVRSTCLTMLDSIATGDKKPLNLAWHGLPARRLEVTFTVAGTDDLHTLIAAAEPTRCLLFETVLIRKSVGLDIAPLSPRRWAILRAQFASILDSVRISRPTASASPPKPASP